MAKTMTLARSIPHVLQNLAVRPITETYPEALPRARPDLVSVLIVESHVRNLGCVKNSGEMLPADSVTDDDRGDPEAPLPHSLVVRKARQNPHERRPCRVSP